MIVVVLDQEVHQTDDVAFGDIDVADLLGDDFLENDVQILTQFLALFGFWGELDVIVFLSDFQDVGTQKLLERRGRDLRKKGVIKEVTIDADVEKDAIGFLQDLLMVGLGVDKTDVVFLKEDFLSLDIQGEVAGDDIADLDVVGIVGNDLAVEKFQFEHLAIGKDEVGDDPVMEVLNGYDDISGDLVDVLVADGFRIKAEIHPGISDGVIVRTDDLDIGIIEVKIDVVFHFLNLNIFVE